MKNGLKAESSEGALTKGVAEVGKNGEKREYSKYSFDYGGKIIHFSPDLGWSSNTGAHAWEIDVQAWNKIEGMSEKIKDEFISKMANNPHNKQVIINLTEKMIANNFKLTEKFEKQKKCVYIIKLNGKLFKYRRKIL